MKILFLASYSEFFLSNYVQKFEGMTKKKVPLIKKFHLCPGSPLKYACYNKNKLLTLENPLSFIIWRTFLPLNSFQQRRIFFTLIQKKSERGKVQRTIINEQNVNNHVQTPNPSAASKRIMKIKVLSYYMLFWRKKKKMNRVKLTIQTVPAPHGISFL